MERSANPDTFKVALIGSHGVGKTTLCFGLAARLKARDFSLEVVHEVARRCPLPINEGTSLEAQAWILHTQIAEELAAAARYPVIICDRAVLDNFTYLELAHGSIEHLERLVNDWLATYDQLVMVPITTMPQADGLRAVDPNFQRKVEDRLRHQLELRRLDFLDLAPIAREAWLDTVEETLMARLQPPQLPLI